jgi:galactose-1-phosphate uridylyltransferase
MPELRKDPIIKRWVIIATERARRPHDFINAKENVESAFCPLTMAMNTPHLQKSWRLGPQILLRTVRAGG